MSLKAKMTRAFDHASHSYDAHATVQKQCARHIAKLTQQTWQGPLKGHKGPTVLDVGTGTGFVPQLLRPHFPKALFILNDIAANMLQTAHTNLAAHNRLQCLLGDIETCNLPPVDIVTASLSLQWVQNLEHTLFRLSKTARLTVFATLLEGTFHSWHTTLRAHHLGASIKAYPALKDVQQMIAQCQPTFCTQEVKRFLLPFSNPNEAVRHLKKTGTQTAAQSAFLPKLLHFLKTNKTPVTLEYNVLFAAIA
ncbi:MAG: methyltransferase domain-containing protein [Holosporaceae bacterium]